MRQDVLEAITAVKAKVPRMLKPISEKLGDEVLDEDRALAVAQAFRPQVTTIGGASFGEHMQGAKPFLIVLGEAAFYEVQFKNQLTRRGIEWV